MEGTGELLSSVESSAEAEVIIDNVDNVICLSDDDNDDTLSTSDTLQEDQTFYMCGFCEKMFETSTDINAHLLTHKKASELRKGTIVQESLPDLGQKGESIVLYDSQPEQVSMS